MGSVGSDKQAGGGRGGKPELSDARRPKGPRGRRLLTRVLAAPWPALAAPSLELQLSFKSPLLALAPGLTYPQLA